MSYISTIISFRDKRMERDQYIVDKNLLRPPSGLFCCSETNENVTLSSSSEDNNATNGKSIHRSPAISFRCNMPAVKEEDTEKLDSESKCRHLSFSCLEPSYGVLTDKEVHADEQAIKIDTTRPSREEEDDDDDFDIGLMLFNDKQYPYALAGRTGFQIWPGSRLMVDALIFPRDHDNVNLQKWQNFLLHRNEVRVLELGAGVGVVGSSLAALTGAEVLLTDLPKVVEKSLLPNLMRNCNTSRHDREQEGCVQSNQQTRMNSLQVSPPTWLDAVATQVVPIGRGWAAAASLDWNEPLDHQLAENQQTVDLVIASDCVWLPSMLQGLLETVSAIFRGVKSAKLERSPPLLLTFQRRDSEMFTTIDRVLHEINSRGWKAECLAWYPVQFDDSDKEDMTVQEVFLFEVSSME